MNIQGNLTDSEWQELLGLEYVLTWNYTNDYKTDLKRHNELSKKRWDWIESQQKPKV